MSAKKYVMCIAAALLFFMAVNVVLWNFTVKNFFGLKDLNRMGYFDTNEALTPNAEYSIIHDEMKDYINGSLRKSFDIITIGDSFTNGGGSVFYQDYLADKYGINSLNFSIKNHCMLDLYLLISSGLIDEIQPKAVILESVERAVQGRLGGYEITPISADREDIERALSHSKSISSKIFIPIMIKANTDFMQSLLYRINDPERLSKEVYIARLDRDLFTNPEHENTLLFYHEDLHYIDRPINPEMVNANLNTAAELLRDKGIKLIFMPCVDKYDLYYPYIIDKKGRPENNSFSEMRKISGKEYIFIDTKAILREALSRGEKDIYWFGDTHWSWKGVELVCDELVEYLRPFKQSTHYNLSGLPD